MVQDESWIKREQGRDENGPEKEDDDPKVRDLVGKVRPGTLTDRTPPFPKTPTPNPDPKIRDIVKGRGR